MPEPLRNHRRRPRQYGVAGASATTTQRAQHPGRLRARPALLIAVEFPPFNHQLAAVGQGVPSVFGTGIRHARFGRDDLRHRRLSLWHRDDIPIREATERAGRARASMTLDTSAHVVIDDREIGRVGALT